MYDLKFYEKEWIKNTFHIYFPHATFYFPTTILQEFIKFKKDELSVLPEHLKLIDKYEIIGQQRAVAVLGLDVPNMIDKQPFRSLIDSTKLTEIKAKVAAGELNIFNYCVRNRYEKMIRNEEKGFISSFKAIIKKMKKTSPVYIEDIPNLFFNLLDHNGINAEYNPDENCFNWDYSSWNFERLIHHKSKNMNIITTYRYFSRRIWHLRIFGVDKDIDIELQNNHKELYNALENFLYNKEIPFYKY